MKAWIYFILYLTCFPSLLGLAEFDNLNPPSLFNEKVKPITQTDINQLLEIKEITPYQINYSRSNKVKIAVVDTGVDFSHPLLAPFKSPIHNSVFFSSLDPHGHGTHVAGIIAANLNQIYGSQAKDLFEIASFSYSTYGPNMGEYNKAIAMAILWGAQVINISASGLMLDKMESDLLKQAQKNHVHVVVAAGNDGSEYPSYPCGYSSVICVGNLDTNQKLNQTSNYGKHVPVYVTGTDILSSLPNQTYGRMTGSSQAAPVVSALAASLIVNPFSEIYFQGKILSYEEVFPKPLIVRQLASETKPAQQAKTNK